jgi:hypothetical protein
MNKKVKKEYLRILELGEKASRDDIENAYSHFVKLYSTGDSPEIQPLREEINRDERKKILRDIDKAYKALVGEDGVNRIDFSAEIEPQEIVLDVEREAEAEHPESETFDAQPDKDEPVVEFEFSEELLVEVPVEKSISEINDVDELIVEIPEREESESEIPEEIEYQEIRFDDDNTDGEEPIEVKVDISDQEEILTDIAPADDDMEITGKFIKQTRESRKMKVGEVGELLNVKYKDLIHIENEKFDKLNDAGYLRWLITSYAKFLGLDERKSAEDYMKRYRLKKKK